MNDQVTAVSKTLRANNELTLTSLRNRLDQLLSRKDVLEAEIRDVREGIYACESTLRGLPAAPQATPAPFQAQRGEAEPELSAEQLQALEAAMNAEDDGDEQRRA